MQLAMREINKRFGSNHVLKDVDLTLETGEVLALLGENGAGKSTLMNILGAVLPADSGTIQVDERTVHWRTPSEALAGGISFIHQELSLINDLPIYENIFLGNFAKASWGRIDHDAMIQATDELFEELGIHLDPRRLVRELDSSYKQIVEIARAFHQNATFIIMDEPTAALTETEIERVFDMIRRLRTSGVGMIFISHKLNEVMEIADRFMVLRNGEAVAEGRVREASVATISAAMVGHELVETASRARPAQDTAPILELSGMTDRDGAYHDIALQLHPGEILGVTGLLGDGRSELFQTVFGARPFGKGTLKVNGDVFHPRSPIDAIERGIGYVPRDRKENGILKDLSILDNSALSTYAAHSRLGVIDWAEVREDFGQAVEQLDIRLQNPALPITALSGGNQQKVVLSRWLTAGSHILILDNPTQGVDVGAKEDIYELIFDLARQGIGIVVLSSEAQEIMRLCDRALVLFAGRMQGMLEHDAMTEQKIMHLATGAALLDQAPSPAPDTPRPAQPTTQGEQV